MLPHLPQEIIDTIAFYLPFEQAVGVSEYMKEKLGQRPSWYDYINNGNLFSIKWIHYHEYPQPVFFRFNAIYSAARDGHLEMIKWLQRNLSEGCTTDAMDCAAQSGHLDIVQWLQKTEMKVVLPMP